MSNTTETIYTGNFNRLGDEACVIQACSDWGEVGWMVCMEMRTEPYTGLKTPKFFFAADQKEEAVECARTL